MPKKSYFNAFPKPNGNKSVGEDLDGIFLKYKKEGAQCDKDCSGYNLLYDLNKNQPLDHDITPDELANGNYAAVDQQGYIKKLGVCVSESGQQYYTFESVKDAAPPKPSLGERFVNFFRSEKNKSPAVKAWNSWKNFQKTADKRKNFLDKGTKEYARSDDQVDGYSMKDYEKEVAAPKRAIAEAVKSEQLQEKFNSDKLTSILNAARNGKQGPEMKALADSLINKEDNAVRLTYHENNIRVSAREESEAVFDYVATVVLLHIGKDNPDIQKRLAENNCDVKKTLGYELSNSLSKAIVDVMGDDKLNVMRDCTNNGGMKVLDKFKNITNQKQAQKAEKEKQLEAAKGIEKKNTVASHQSSI